MKTNESAALFKMLGEWWQAGFGISLPLFYQLCASIVFSLSLTGRGSKPGFLSVSRGVTHQIVVEALHGVQIRCF